MPKPSINATIQDLQRQMAKGGMSPASPGSSGNISAGANMRPAMASSGGGTGGTGANPPRMGNPPISNVGPSGASSRDHALTLASTTHLAKMGHMHPQHHQIRAMAQAGIAASKGAKAKAPMAPRKFGALGAAPMAGGGGMGGGPSPVNSGMDDDGY